jgi:carboxyl-terminal processing protease
MNDIQNEIPKKHKALKKVLFYFFIIVLLFASFGAGMYMSGKNEVIKNLATKEAVYAGKITGQYSQPPKGELSQDVDFNLFWNTWDALKENFVDKSKINDKEMFYGALHGLVASLGDPYTVFMDPKIAQEFSQDLAGTFEGIGAELGIKKDVLTIIAPLPDMPAEKAGLKAGDKILAIDGKSTQGISVDEAVSKIRGPKNTKVTLTILRDGMDKPKDFSINRDKIIVKSVRTDYQDANKLMVIKVTNFNDDTKALFDEAVAKTIEKNPAGVIIDLRNNPGGYLDTAVDMASKWIEEGPVVVEQFTNDKKNEYLARGRALLKDFHTVVLVNQGSASASEIVAGALQDDNKAILVGMKTFGKGSVQTLETLKDGSSVKITVAKWLTPKGRSINEEGIMPDIVVDLTAENFNANKDPQMDKAVSLLKLKDFNIDNIRKENATSTKEK